MVVGRSLDIELVISYPGGVSNTANNGGRVRRLVARLTFHLLLAEVIRQISLDTGNVEALVLWGRSADAHSADPVVDALHFHQVHLWTRRCGPDPTALSRC